MKPFFYIIFIELIKYFYKNEIIIIIYYQNNKKEDERATVIIRERSIYVIHYSLYEKYVIKLSIMLLFRISKREYL